MIEIAYLDPWQKNPREKIQKVPKKIKVRQKIIVFFLKRAIVDDDIEILTIFIFPDQGMWDIGSNIHQLHQKILINLDFSFFFLNISHPFVKKRLQQFAL